MLLKKDEEFRLNKESSTKFDENSAKTALANLFSTLKDEKD